MANKSIDDKGGWDYEVENRAINKIDYGRHSYPVYRVQVKATTDRAETRITYSNLLKLIRYNGASFIVLFVYSGQMNPDFGYIFHIDEEFSRILLREIRKKQISSKPFSLNKNEKTIKFSSNNEISLSDGRELIEYLEKSTGPNYLRYVENKTKYLSKFEQEGQSKIFELTFKDKQSINSMLHNLLGYNEKFTVDVHEYNAPFGIVGKKPNSFISKYETQLLPTEDTLKKGTISLRTSKYGKIYTFDCDGYLTPKELWGIQKKLRIKCTLFDFSLDFHNNLPQFHPRNPFSDDTIVKFNELHNYFQFLYESNSGGETYVSFSRPGKKATKDIFLGPLRVEVPSLDTIARFLKATYKKLCEMNLEKNKISTLFVKNNLEMLYLFDILDNHYKPGCSFEIPHQGMSNPDADVMILNYTIEFVEIYLLIFVAFFGRFEKKDENSIIGIFNRSEFLADLILNKNENIKDTQKAELDRLTRQFVANGLTVLKTTQLQMR